MAYKIRGMRTSVPPLAPLTPQQEEVVRLAAQGKTPRECAADLGVSYNAVIDRARWAAQKIPGDLPIWPRLIVWSRGADRKVLGAE